MSTENIYIYGAILVGLGATLFMDLWALILRRAFNIALPNYCFVGRWLRHMPTGTFKHTSIAAAPKKTAECTTGWIAHYLIGAAYALILIIPAASGWLARPTLLPALLVGIGTVLIPYFVMQPCFGLGIAAAKTPNPAQARLRSLMSHTAYGVGLYVSAYPLGYVVRAHV
ncbi:MAG: hypothetical protein FD165_950 [Gammaproteobacteria bacterium]|nr:MAG: hypothetical protein FD165_950 [Gammaproteobacteria bacterium]TND06341.1 MAG: hypothetical protein FD120_828 [Gammaproteobacteria bacterium]